MSNFVEEKTIKHINIDQSIISEIYLDEGEVFLRGQVALNDSLDQKYQLFLVFKNNEDTIYIDIDSSEIRSENNDAYTFHIKLEKENIKQIQHSEWLLWIEVHHGHEACDQQRVINKLDKETLFLRVANKKLWKLTKTENEQLLITSTDSGQELRKYNIDGKLLSVEMVNSTTLKLNLKGEFYPTTEENKYLQLRKRASSIQKDIPLITNSLGEGSIELDITDLKDEKTAGIWDFYLVQNILGLEVSKRLNSENEEISEGIPPILLREETPLLNANLYSTIKGNISLLIDNISFQGEITELLQEGWKLNFNGELYSSSLCYVDFAYPARLKAIKKDTNEVKYFPFEWGQIQNSTNVYFKSNINLEEFLETSPEEIKGTWNFYIEGKIDDQIETILLTFPNDVINRYKYLKSIHVDEKLHCYISLTKGKNLCFIIKSLGITRNVEVYKTILGHIHIKGWAFIDGEETYQDTKRYIIFQKRFTDEKVMFPLNVKKRIDINEKYGQETINYTWSGFKVKYNLRNIFQSESLSEGIWDLFIAIEHNGELVSRKLGFQRYSYRKDGSIQTTSIHDKKEKKTKTHYSSLTPRGNIKIEIMSFDFSQKLLMFFSPLLYLFHYRKKDIWIIGERPDTAQDTGYHFFKYCREKYPDREIYYAIDPESNDIGNIKDLGNVLYFNTKEHFKLSLFASTFISSHDIEYFIPFKGYSLFNYRMAKKIFLQHGVLGRKNVEYHRNYYNYPFDIFCVSSKGEKKQIVIDQMQYPKKDVKITGLSRFDALPLEQDLSNSRKILCIPTWREWLNTDEQFLSSTYYNRYCELLQSQELLDILEKYNLEFIFYPHYRMQPYIELFNIPDNKRIKVIKLGEKKVQDLLIQSSIMITDFSSVSFDFSYMNKPVIFYHFDFDTFFKRGILRDPEETFLGSIVHDVSSINSELESYIQNDYKEKEEVSEKKDLIFTYTDHHNCERIFDVITKRKKRKYYPIFIKVLYRKTLKKIFG
ncbi:CDP-glycerol glycerophosphotransferase family protein [Heyndrickxia sporothermodurans]